MQPVTRDHTVFAVEHGECTLVSASCTTGWTDWIHGELWVCPDGLFRRALGLRATIAHGSGPTVDPIGRSTRRISTAEVAQATSRRRNYWVTWDSVARAELRHGFLTDSLHLQLKDGGRRKFLWLAVDQAHVILANALEASIGTRLVQRSTKPGVAEARGSEHAETEEWPVTLVASWVDPGVDMLELRGAIALLVAGAWATGAQLVVDGRIDASFLALGVLAISMVGWRGLRTRRALLELVLSPNSARVRERRGGVIRTFEFARQRAGWLMAGESGLDWHDRSLAVHDDAQRLIAQFKARRASVTARADSARGDAWLQTHLPGADRGKKDGVSVTALMGAWWPHPERRVSVRGNAAVRHPWKEPDLGSYPAWDRKQRRLYAAVFGAFMLFFVVIGIALPMSLGEGIAYFPLVLGGLAFAARHVIW